MKKYSHEEKMKYYSSRANDNSLTEGQRQYAKDFIASIKDEATYVLPLRKRRDREEQLRQKWNDENNRTVKGVIEQIKGLSYKSRLRSVRIRNKKQEILYLGDPRFIPQEVLQMKMETAIPSRSPYEKNAYIIWTEE
jgi:uncharacterized protein (DUF2126 family)